MVKRLKYVIFLLFGIVIVSSSHAQENILFELVQDEPIIRAGDGGNWSRSLQNSGAVMFYGGQFHMFRNGYPTLPGNSVVGYATSDDAIHWTHYENNPVLQTDDVPYADMIMASSVLVMPDGKWVLYFLIWDSPEHPGAIGRATAPDPIGPWIADESPVLLPGGEGAWDATQVTQPSVLFDESGKGYLMYYTGVDDDRVERVGLASSPDGITWTKYDNPHTLAPLYAESDPILQPGGESEWDERGASRGRVVHTDDGYVMIYRTPILRLGFTYGVAISEDGIEWHKYVGNPILTSDNIEGASGLFFSTFMYHDGTYYFFIEGYNGISHIYLLTHDVPLAITTQEKPMPIVRTLVEELPSATGGLAVDQHGNIYAANIGLAPQRNGTHIYRISLDGEVELWVEDEELLGASGNTFDAEGNLYQSSLNTSRVLRISPDGDIAVFADKGVTGPVGVAFAPDNSLLVANCRRGNIQRVTADGESAIYARSSLFACPNGITLDPDGNAYVANFSNGRVIKITPDGEASLFAEIPGGGNGHILYHNGLLYVVALRASQIYTLTLDGELILFAGTGERGHDDGPALEASFTYPNDIIASPDGRYLYVNERVEIARNLPSVIRLIELPQVEEE